MSTDRNQQSPRQIARRFDQILESSPAYRQLDVGTKSQLRGALATIADKLSSSPDMGDMARALAPPDLQSRLSRGGGNGGSQPSQSSQPPPQASGSPATSQPSPAGQPGAADRVGQVARATLDAIGFPDFVASLITGTFQAIVDSSIQQMQAYAELLSSVAGSVDKFMNENVSPGMARDHLAEQYGGVFSRQVNGGGPELVINRDFDRSQELPSFFQDLGFSNIGDMSEDDVEEVVVPAARRSLAETRQQTLATMILMGINRVVIDDGEINAKLQFHIDASEATELKFDQTKTTTGNIAGRAGSSPFTANAILVNTTSLNAQSDLSVRADLTGQVKVRFRSDYFPLERFADSAAIQLINRHARVPSGAASGQPAVGTSSGGSEAPGTEGQGAVGTQGSDEQGLEGSAEQPVVSQGLVDPWTPR